MSNRLVRAAGGVVYSFDPEGTLTLLLIHDSHEAWTLPKGHLEAGENDHMAAVREIAEETGITCVIERLVARVRYPVYKHDTWRDKEVAYFLAHAPHLTPIPAEDEGIVVATWMPPTTALNILTYRQVRGVVVEALAILEGRGVNWQ